MSVLESLTDAELGALWLDWAGWTFVVRDEGPRYLSPSGEQSVFARSLSSSLPTALRIVVPEMREHGWDPMPARSGWAWMPADDPSDIVARHCDWAKPEQVARAVVESSGRARGWW